RRPRRGRRHPRRLVRAHLHLRRAGALRARGRVKRARGVTRAALRGMITRGDLVDAGAPDASDPTVTPDSPTLAIPVRIELGPEAEREDAPGAAPPAPPPLRATGRYVVEDELGRGGMAVVYRA